MAKHRANSASYGSLPFGEQITFFRRKINLPTEDWTQLFEAGHDHGFVVAGANRDDLVTDFRAAVDKAISQGTSLEQFRKDFDSIVAKYGWDYHGGRNWRSRVIYETNLRTSYAAGRYAQLQAVKKSRPYWQYVHSDAVEHPRPQHLAWHGLVLHADDPWWKIHFPSNGWGCECTVHALNKRDLAKLGKSGPDQAPPVDLKEVVVGATGAHPRTVTVPDGIDPGFGYAPGATVRANWLTQRAEQIMMPSAPDDGAHWQPLMTSTAAELHRPVMLPLAKPSVTLGPKLTNADQVRAALIRQLGGESQVFDVHGLPVAIDAAALSQHLNSAHTPFLPWLSDLLTNPFEIWRNLFKSSSGHYELRSVIVKAYDVGNGSGTVLVAQQRGGFLESLELIPAGSDKLIDMRRMGMLWYGK